jgi:hypothetical protein
MKAYLEKRLDMKWKRQNSAELTRTKVIEISADAFQSRVTTERVLIKRSGDRADKTRLDDITQKSPFPFSRNRSKEESFVCVES